MLILDPKILIIWVLLDKDLKKLFSCLKSAPSNLWKCEFSCWKKEIEFRNKIPLFGIIWMDIFKNFCQHWNQHLQIYQKIIFSQYSKLWHGFQFFISLGSTFFGGPGIDFEQCLLYKSCCSDSLRSNIGSVSDRCIYSK